MSEANERVGFNLTKYELEMLDILCKHHDVKRVELFRRWIFQEGQRLVRPLVNKHDEMAGVTAELPNREELLQMQALRAMEDSK